MDVLTTYSEYVHSDCTFSCFRNWTPWPTLMYSTGGMVTVDSSTSLVSNDAHQAMLSACVVRCVRVKGYPLQVVLLPLFRIGIRIGSSSASMALFPTRLVHSMESSLFGFPWHFSRYWPEYDEGSGWCGCWVRCCMGSRFQKLMTCKSHSFTRTHPFIGLIILKKEVGHIHAYSTRYPFPYRV